MCQSYDPLVWNGLGLITDIPLEKALAQVEAAEAVVHGHISLVVDSLTRRSGRRADGPTMPDHVQNEAIYPVFD